MWQDRSSALSVACLAFAAKVQHGAQLAMEGWVPTVVGPIDWLSTNLANVRRSSPVSQLIAYIMRLSGHYLLYSADGPDQDSLRSFLMGGFGDDCPRLMELMAGSLRVWQRSVPAL